MAMFGLLAPAVAPAELQRFSLAENEMDAVIKLAQAGEPICGSPHWPRKSLLSQAKQAFSGATKQLVSPSAGQEGQA
jgi:hypothetical protein